MIRINDEIARVTASVIRSELSDPRIGTVVSVLRAETTTDLKYCKIFVSVLGEDYKDTMDALNGASRFIRKRIADIINLRQTPELKFIFDDSIEHGMRMRQLIESVNPTVTGGAVHGADTTTDS
jgi:ribosome-binding factor A